MKLSRQQTSAISAYIIVLAVFCAALLSVICCCYCYQRRTKLVRKKVTSYSELETDEFDDKERSFREAITEHGNSTEVTIGNAEVVVVMLYVGAMDVVAVVVVIVYCSVSRLISYICRGW
jgi:hypothetical protein